MSVLLHSLAAAWLLIVAVVILYFLIKYSNRYFWQGVALAVLVFLALMATAISIAYLSGVEIVWS